MARILLIFPASLYRNFTPPLNLAYIAAALEQAGHEVRVIDLSALHPDCTEDEAIRRAAEFDPLWIGLTMNVIFIHPAYQFARKLRRLGKPVVAGGPHPSLLASEALEHGCDIVVRGEGEQTVVHLTRALEQGDDLQHVQGISYRDADGAIQHNPSEKLIQDLDALPFPSKHLFSEKWYTENSETYQVFGAIFSGRGCPASCHYCYKGVFGHGCRMRSAENVFAEMLELNRKYGVTAFEFMDDAFSADLDRVDKLCDLILAEPGFSPKWQCTTRMDFTERDLLRKMSRSGCFRIFYGVESGDKETLFRVNKHLDHDQAIDVLRWTREAGIRSIIGFMWGFPWDSPASVRASVAILKRMAPYADEFNPLGILIPVPGTQIFETYKSQFDLEAWWLSDKFGKLYRENTYFPYFQRRFYNDFGLLHDGFFPFSRHVRRAIHKGIHFIGFHNLFHNTPLGKALIVYAAVWLSKILFAIHPELEKATFSLLEKVKGFA